MGPQGSLPVRSRSVRLWRRVRLRDILRRRFFDGDRDVGCGTSRDTSGRAADPSDPAQRLSSWLGQPSPNLWGNASTGGRPTTAGAKSIYDPCPPGWRVPPPEAWTLEQTTVSSTIEGGCYLYTGSVWPYYPYAGLLHVMPTGKEMYVGVGIRTQLWTNVPGSPASDPSRVDATTAVSFGVLPPEVLQLYRQNHQAAAYPVRCVKE